MELLRKAPLPLELSYPAGTFDSDSDYVVGLASTRNSFVEEYEVHTDLTGGLNLGLSEDLSRYDAEYSMTIWWGTANNKSDVALLDNLRIVRPYVNTAVVAPVGKDEEYAKYERIARIMIDNIVGGFYYTSALYDIQGTGTDKLVVGHRVNKLLSLTENNVLVYELGGTNNLQEYTLTSDKNSIIVFQDGVEDNRLDGRPVTLPAGGSDSYSPGYRSPAFPNGYDYTVQVETGWPMVPQDIQEAASLIIEDMACGAPNYWSKYVREYETKDYRVDFHRPAFAGTGNVIVDQILHRYLGETLYNNIRVL